MASDNVQFEETSFPSSVPPDTKIRTSVSTETGHTDAEIQHVKLDDGKGLNDQPVNVQNDAFEIAKGNVSGTTVVYKFGEAGNIDIADGFVDVWDGANNITGLTKTSMDQYTYSTTADIDSLVSSDAGDTVDIEVHGLDTSYNLVVQTVTLNGRTRVALGTDLIRVYRMKNVGASVLAGNVFCYVDGSLTAGVPNTEIDIRAIIQIGNEQTLMTLYTIPNGKTGYISNWYASLSQRKDQNSDVRMFFRTFGGVFQIKHASSLMATGTSHIQHAYVFPLSGLSGKTDITIRTDTSKNDGSVAAGFDVILVDD